MGIKNTLLKYINTKGIGSYINNVTIDSSLLPDPSTLGVGSEIEVTDINGNTASKRVTTTGYTNVLQPRQTKLVSK